PAPPPLSPVLFTVKMAGARRPSNSSRDGRWRNQRLRERNQVMGIPSPGKAENSFRTGVGEAVLADPSSYPAVPVEGIAVPGRMSTNPPTFFPCTLLPGNSNSPCDKRSAVSAFRPWRTCHEVRAHYSAAVAISVVGSEVLAARAAGAPYSHRITGRSH